MSPCADDSERRGDPLAATASTARTYLLLEDPGPWGPHILHSTRLGEAARDALRRARRTYGVRPLLIRRPWLPAGRRRVIVANALHGWAQSTLVDDLAEVADLDLAGVRGPDGVGLPDHGAPIAVVCTHGKHDPCCATRGRPLAAALASSHPDVVWEGSHLGGDRFAGNLLMLPRGDYFGRLDAASGPAAVASYLAGELDLEHHRGRSSQPWAVQAAEASARRASGASAFSDVRVRRVTTEGGTSRVALDVRGQRWDAAVTVDADEPARLTCHADAPEPPPRYRVTFESQGNPCPSR